jgi:hypothetical protein
VHKSISTVSELTESVNRFNDHGMSLISEQKNSNEQFSYATGMDTSNQILLSDGATAAGLITATGSADVIRPTIDCIVKPISNSNRGWEGQPVPASQPNRVNFSEIISRKRGRQLTAEARLTRTAAEATSDSDGAHISSDVRGASERTRRSRIGVSQTSSNGLQAASDLIKKKVYCVNNASATTTCASMTDFVNKMNVRCLSCFDTKTRYKNARAFRICIRGEDKAKFLDMNHWPTGIVIRDWVFKGTVEVATAGALIGPLNRPTSRSLVNDNDESVDDASVLIESVVMSSPSRSLHGKGSHINVQSLGSSSSIACESTKSTHIYIDSLKDTAIASNCSHGGS